MTAGFLRQLQWQQARGAARTLKSDPRTVAIPVVMLSADATPGQIDRFRSADLVQYLSKPLDVTQFLQVIDEVMAARSSA